LDSRAWFNHPWRRNLLDEFSATIGEQTIDSPIFGTQYTLTSSKRLLACCRKGGGRGLDKLFFQGIELFVTHFVSSDQILSSTRLFSQSGSFFENLIQLLKLGGDFADKPASDDSAIWTGAVALVTKTLPG